MLPPNTTLQNRYRIVRPLGQGGMGTIYEAIDQRVNAVVALKETHGAGHEQARREFEREAGLLANLRHRALPKVMDYFMEGEGEYVVMEYVEGYDLLELLNRRGAPFSVEQALKWADEVLDVLEYLHKRQPPILHRDLKPANLRLTRNEELFLLDFGLAKGAAGQMPTLLTERSARGYTPVYAPLEQIIGKGTDQRSDLYSLGATLYHLLTGVPPTDAPTRYELLESGQPDPLLPISNLNLKVPPQVAATIHQAMAIQRKDRFDSATVMRQALGRAREEAQRSASTARQKEDVRSQPVLVGAPQPPAQQPPTDAPRRRLTPLVLAGVAILAVAAIIVVVALTRRGASEGKAAADAVPAPSPQSTLTPKPAGPPQSVTENINGAKLEMLLIPGGTFVMGSPAGVGYNSERPQHQVTVQPFYMGKYEVTQAQYKALMGVNPSEFQGNDLPVENVSWKDAVEFCSRLSRVTRREYRLPTEAEWEYTCRAETTTLFSYGDSLSSEQANFDGNSPAGGAPKGVYRQKTTPVGSFKPNAFGLYDMHGNVWEWCEDVYHDSYDGAPADGSAWLAQSGSRVLRGGSWLSAADGLRSAVRERLAPEESSSGIGFRVVMVAR